MARTNLAIAHSYDEEEIPRIVGKKVKIEAMKKIEPKTENQKLVFQEYKKGNNLLLRGSAGTGKTFLAVYLSLRDVLLRESGYDKIIVIRSAVPTRELGFLPGTLEEKLEVYEEPYAAIFEELFPNLKNGSTAIEKIKATKVYDFASSSYLRGITFHNAIVIVDEMQNMTFPEIDTIMTRLGDNCKIIFCGDEKQTDLHKKDDKSGMFEFCKIINKMETFSSISFGVEDIVRSNLVKQYITLRDGA